MFMCALPVKAIPKMTYTVSDGILNPTQSLTYLKYLFICSYCGEIIYLLFIWIPCSVASISTHPVLSSIRPSICIHSAVDSS